MSLDGGREFGSPASIQLSLKSFSFAALQRHHVLSASLFLPATDLRNRVMGDGCHNALYGVPGPGATGVPEVGL